MHWYLRYKYAVAEFVFCRFHSKRSGHRSHTFTVYGKLFGIALFCSYNTADPLCDEFIHIIKMPHQSRYLEKK